ncbi:hypothetical protein BAE44_0014477, partial [Dichanthelium oligosanthes]
LSSAVDGSSFVLHVMALGRRDSTLSLPLSHSIFGRSVTLEYFVMMSRRLPNYYSRSSTKRSYGSPLEQLT